MKSLIIAAALLSLFSPALAIDTDQANVRSFIDEMVREHEFDREQVTRTLKQAERKESILEAIARPAEKTLTWAEYRRIFITPERIQAGAEFWREHRQTLAEISNSSGVPTEILLGILGVETYFGRITGGYRVLDALATLAFHYPPRAAFFRKELIAYMLLVRDEGMQVDAATGSYAGAMGRPQFMPSSFRAYAIDSTGDGKRDIWNSWADTTASVANYFNAHGWRSGQQVIAEASLGGRWSGPAPKYENTLTPKNTVGSMSAKGVLFATDLPCDSKGELLAFDGENGVEYWVAFRNFFVITRYNRNVMYALAVHQLGREIALTVENESS